ncbi:hypothetical protein HMPREF1212_00746 [Parabacteroides sp. HGS0025]|nr:hypothetical protein HMPREF1212_00746 [Parabacteroides sp. HGS0025]
MDNFLFLQSYEPPVTKDIFFVWGPLFCKDDKDEILKNRK